MPSYIPHAQRLKSDVCVRCCRSTKKEVRAREMEMKVQGSQDQLRRALVTTQAISRGRSGEEPPATSGSCPFR